MAVPEGRATFVTEFYFAYGSNMSTARLAARVDDAQARGSARLPDHRLTFDKPGRDGTGKANICAAAGECVHGVVWALSRSALEALDTYEPGYERRATDVDLISGARLSAWIYLHEGGDPDLAPESSYLEHLILGAREHVLPSDHISLLESILDTLAAR